MVKKDKKSETGEVKKIREEKEKETEYYGKIKMIEVLGGPMSIHIYQEVKGKQ